MYLFENVRVIFHVVPYNYKYKTLLIFFPSVLFYTKYKGVVEYKGVVDKSPEINNTNTDILEAYSKNLFYYY